MPLAAEAQATVLGYHDRTEAVRARVRAYVEARWRGLGTYHEADIARFVAAVLPAVLGGQRAVASLTADYLATIEAEIRGVTVRRVGMPAAALTDEALRGTSAEDVWRRPGRDVWNALDRGEPLARATDIGLSRALVLADTDLQLAKRAAAQHAMADRPAIVAYRRVINPGACSLCTHADVKYAKSELMPIHGGCFCSMVPVFRGKRDPGTVTTGEGGGSDRGAPVVRQHGELGPVLTSAADDFSSLG